MPSPAKGCAWAVGPHASAEEHKTSHGCALPRYLGKESSKVVSCGTPSLTAGGDPHLLPVPWVITACNVPG